jgi:hypothetical protein
MFERFLLWPAVTITRDFGHRSSRFRCGNYLGRPGPSFEFGFDAL